MKTIILDSIPSIPLRIPDAQLNVSPAYRTKTRGQPLLGQPQVRYSYYVPLGEGSRHLKKLLELPETDASTTNPVGGYDELMKAEKINVGDIKSSASAPPIQDQAFSRDAKKYLGKPKTARGDTYEPKADLPPTTEKNDAEIATIIAAAQPQKRVISSGKVRLHYQSKPTKKKKKKHTASLSIKSFRIVGKKKKL